MSGQPQDGGEGAGGQRPAAMVVGLGASAGGLDALQKIFAAIPPRPGLAFVVVQHLEPRHPSMLVDLLARHTAMPVVEAADGMALEADHVYVIAPGTLLALEGGLLRVTAAVDPTAHAPIDTLFRSLAEDRRERAIAIVLSGAGHDGTAGLRAIKERGGLTLAQDPASRYTVFMNCQGDVLYQLPPPAGAYLTINCFVC